MFEKHKKMSLLSLLINLINPC